MRQQSIILGNGRFFGEARLEAATPSFGFSEMNAVCHPREIPRHTHATSHFVLVVRAPYATAARNQSGPCAPGTLIFNPAGTTHRDCFCVEGGRFLSISPLGDAASLLDRAPPVPLVLGPAALALVQSIRGALRGDQGAAPLQLEELGLELVAELSGFGEKRRGNAPADWLLRARQLLDQETEAARPIAAIAATVGVHRVYLARAFRRAFGCTPSEYGRRRRVARARQLLVETRLPVVEIAQRCGFADQSQMTHAFTATLACPPGRFRRLVSKVAS